jgi:ABC-2 type transport system ATP-binding protein
MSSEAAIEVEGIAKHYGDVHALDGVDLTATQGKVLGLLGPNGAGKTTLVRVLATLIEPDAGVARVTGLDVVADAARVRERIGLAGQYAAVDENLTGLENLTMVGRLYGEERAPAKRRGRELLERFDLTDAADRPAKTYSGGMRRRLDLAAALVAEPPVLFLDEPTTGLDPLSRRAIWDEVRALNRDGTTVFLTTQYLEEADQLADRVGIIANGAMAAEDTSEALKAGVGRTHLEMRLAEGQGDRAREIISRFGECMHVENGAVSVSLERGVSDVAPIVTALSEAGLAVESLDVVEPTLDDVFLATTGQTLEGSIVDAG